MVKSSLSTVAETARSHRVAALIVTYRPDLDRLRALIAIVAEQVAHVWIIANAAEPALRAMLETLPERPRHRMLDINLGLAAAQNIGIELALAAGASHLLLLDQDSRPARAMVARQLAALRAAERRGLIVAAVAPNFADDRRGTALKPFFRFMGGRLRALGCDAADPAPRIDIAIASGLLIPRTALRRVGPMRAELFIDLVDIDWCLRARQAGLTLLAACDAHLEHRLGETPRRLFGRAVTHHGPARNYYFFRNALWLCRQPHAPLAWKLAVGGQLMRRYLLYPLLFAPRLTYWRLMTLGLWHGWRGRLGAGPVAPG